MYLLSYLNFPEQKKNFSSSTNEYNRQNNKNNRQKENEYKVNPTDDN